MRRVVLLFLSSWATNRLRRRNGGLPQPEVPLITAMQDGNQRVIASVDEAARRLKLRPGVTIAHAQSLVPGLHIHDAMPQEDDAALARLALWCTRRSAGLFIDIAGSAHLFRGETAFLQDLKNRTVASKIAARARAAARSGFHAGRQHRASHKDRHLAPQSQYRAPSQTSCGKAGAG